MLPPLMMSTAPNKPVQVAARQQPAIDTSPIRKVQDEDVLCVEDIIVVKAADDPVWVGQFLGYEDDSMDILRVRWWTPFRKKTGAPPETTFPRHTYEPGWESKGKPWLGNVDISDQRLVLFGPMDLVLTRVTHKLRATTVRNIKKDAHIAWFEFEGK
jgi:hypothetical protein